MASKAKRKPVKKAVAKKTVKKIARKIANKNVKKVVAKKPVPKVAKKAARKAAAPKPVKAARKLVKPARNKPAAKRAAAGPDKTTGCAPGYQQFTPSLVVRSVADAVRFYEQAFGFKLDFTMPGPDGTPAHVQMTYHGGRIMFSPEGAFGATNKTPATLGVEPAMQAYVYCPDVDALALQAAAAGAKILMPPADMFWGDRMLHLEDADGYRWAFATNIGDFDPLMKDPRNPH